MFRHITADTILASVQALAAGKQPEIETGILLAHYLPQSLGLESALKMDAEPELLPLEYRRMQRRFHAQAVASWGVMGGRDGDYVLIPLGNEWEAAAPERNAAVAKGFHLCGTLGLTADNAPLVLTEPEPTAEDFAPLMQACLVSLWPKANGMPGPGTGTGTGNPPIPKDGPTAWLDELMALPDTRNTGTKGGLDA